MSMLAAEKSTSNSKQHFIGLSAGKLMGLRQITDDLNKFRVLALDQSNSFKKALRVFNEKAKCKDIEPSYEQIRDTKLEMVKILGAHASAVLLDVNFGARQSVNSFALPRATGLIVRLEASKDAGIASELEPGWSVEKIKRMGASAVKLLVYLDTEDKALTKSQMDFVQMVSKECQKHDILLMTEELSFPRKGEDKAAPAYKARKVKNILEATRLIGPWTDILKLEFPGQVKDDSASQLQDNLGRLNEAAIRPWVLLSAGEKFDLFVKQVDLAMSCGASGYMAGRAIFNEYFEQTPPEGPSKFLASTGVERMKAINQIVESKAKSWNGRYEIGAAELSRAVSPSWYLNGKAAPAAQAGEVKGDY